MVYMESYYYKLQLLNNNQVETVFFIFIVKMTSAKQLETIFVELFVEKSTYNQTILFKIYTRFSKILPGF